MKKCKVCLKDCKLIDFVDTEGKLNPRGKTCFSCRLDVINKINEEMLLKGYVRSTIIIRSLQISNQQYWYENVSIAVFSDYLRYKERNCLYCGTDFGGKFSREKGGINHYSQDIEHMNPLDLGGENSIKNLAVSCKICNSKKGRMRFDEWLKKIDEPFRANSRRYYINRHKCEPEDFLKKSTPTTRDALIYPENHEYLKCLISVNELAIKFKTEGKLRIMEKDEAQKWNEDLERFEKNTFESIVRDLIPFPWEI